MSLTRRATDPPLRSRAQFQARRLDCRSSSVTLASSRDALGIAKFDLTSSQKETFDCVHRIRSKADFPATVCETRLKKKPHRSKISLGPQVLNRVASLATLSNLSDCAILCLWPGEKLGSGACRKGARYRMTGLSLAPGQKEERATRQPAGQMMISLGMFLVRLIGGLIVLSVVWFVLDTINDRNTEIIVATIGLLYSFIFMTSRRLQYFGLTIFSFFGRTSSYVRHVPYDQVLRDEVGLQHPAGRHLYLNVVFAALIEILCLFRLFASLLGHGWETLSAPIQSILHSAQL